MKTSLVPPTMRAVTLSGQGYNSVSVTQVATPVPSSTQLLARVDAAGVCTSLLKLIEQGASHPYLYGWNPADHPLILGDEGAVTLVQVGADLKHRYTAGERYVIQPAVDHAPLHHLERYTNAQEIQKLAVGYTLPGHLAEYILITEETIESGCLLPLKDASTPFAHAAMAEPLSCVVSAQEHHVRVLGGRFSRRHAQVGIKTGGVTVVLGAGAMGRMHVEVALSYAPAVLIVSDFDAARLALVTSLYADKAARKGTTLITVSASEDVRAVTYAQSQHRGADDVIVAAASSAAITLAQTLVTRGGVLNLFAGLKRQEANVAFDTSLIHYQEIIVTGSSGGGPADITRTLELISSGEVDPSAHIACVADLSHVPEVLGLMRAQKLAGKTVIYPHHTSGRMRLVDAWTAADEQAFLSATPLV